MAHDGCLSSITIPSTYNGTIVSKIISFENSNFKNITIPDSVDTIGEGAFSNCKNLESIELPNKITKITKNTFYGFSNLKNISIPNSVDSVNTQAFLGCESLEYNTYDNACYLGNKSNPYLLLVKPKTINITSFNVNENCKVIGTDAFAELKYLTKITIPDSVIAINRAAFSKCSNLEYVKIGDGVTTIDIFAFDAIAFNSADIIIGESVSLIKNDVFRSYNLLGKNSNIYYVGSEEEWNNITIYCLNAMEKFTIRYYLEEEPTENINNYWRYVDGVPTAW